MSILRKRSKEGWTTINNDLLSDTSLSWEAIGIACHLLSKPNDWVIRMTYLVSVGKDGEKAVRNAMQELAAAGYLMRYREQDQTGKLQTVTIIADHPAFINEGTPQDRINGYAKHADIPQTDISSTDTSVSDTSVRGRSLLSTDVPNTDVLSTKKGRGSRASEATEQVGQLPPPTPHASPFLVNGMTAGELAKQRGQAQKYSPEYKWEIHRPVFEALVDIMGVQALVDADDGRVIGDYQDVAVILVKAGLTADAVLARKEQWLTTWPGKDGGSLSQLKMFLVKKAAHAQAEQMVKVRVLVRPNQGDAFHDIISMPEREAREGNYEIVKG